MVQGIQWLHGQKMKLVLSPRESELGGVFRCLRFDGQTSSTSVQFVFTKSWLTETAAIRTTKKKDLEGHSAEAAAARDGSV